MGDIQNGATDTCLDVTASDVVIDGQGHTVGGVDRSASSIGIQFDGPATIENVTLRNVTLTDWETAVQFGPRFGAGVRNGTLVGVTATSNDVGIVLGNTSGTTVARSVARANDGPGIDVAGATGATVRDNRLRRNFGGIEVGYGAADVVVSNNTVRSDDVTAILVAAPTATVADNHLRDNQYGIAVRGFGPADVDVTRNVVGNSTKGGIVAARPGSTFERNTLRGGQVGVVALGAPDTAFRGTTVVNTSNAAIAGLPRQGEVRRSSDNVTVTDADLGFDNATVSFTLRDAAVRPAASVAARSRSPDAPVPACSRRRIPASSTARSATQAAS